jgi:hypothetical protein
MTGPFQHTTRVDNERLEIMENSNALTKDALILAREASHRIVADDLRSFEITQAGKDYRLEVRARR